MSSIESWVKKYRSNVDGNIFHALSIAIKMTYFQNVVHSGAGSLEKNSTDLDDLLFPELYFVGISWIQMISRDEQLLELDAFKTYKHDFKDCTREINERKHMNFLDSFYGDFQLDAPINLARIEVQVEKMSEIAKKKLRNRDIAFSIATRKLFDEAYGSKGYVSCEDYLQFCRDWVEGNIDQNQDEQTLDIRELAQKYTRIRQEISEKVFCQDAAIRKFLQGLFTGEMRGRDDKRSPEASFLFVGPPGVGKTYLASNIAKLLNRECRVFQMNEYADKSSFNGLVGFSPTWKDAKEGELTSYVSANPDAVLIFDEIEKAHLNTIRQFLSILEGGFLRDLFTETDVDFSRTIVIFTTNAGRDFYEEKREESISAIPEATIIDALKKDKDEDGKSVMPTEILSRMAKGYIIGFDHMNPAKLIPIIKKGMADGRDIVLNKLGLECEFDESLLPYLFLFHLGSELDARVASFRSKNFVTDSIFNIVERIGSDPERYGSDHIHNIRFEVENEPLAEEYTQNPNKAKFILVSYKRDRELMLPDENDDFEVFYAWDKLDENGDQKCIVDIMSEHQIDAILIDPFMTGQSDEADPDDLEGLMHLHTHGNNVLQWVLSKENMPPVYVLEMHEEISLVDQLELQNAGIKGLINMVDCDAETCKKKVNDLVYEMFLSEKIDTLVRKGRSLDFEIGENITEDDIEIRLYNFKLISNMNTEATEIVVNDVNKPKLTFDDIIGADAAKEELRKFIKYLENPKAYLKSGLKISRGILLYGPPGTGKTLMAKALAAEADCPFIDCTGAKFVSGEKDIVKIFAQARRYAPSIVFIDEIDSFAIPRSASDTHRSTLVNSLLTEMDGFASNSSKPVFVIAATNAADEPDLNGTNIYLDEALLRRFTKKVYVGLPDREGRLKYLVKTQEKLKDNLVNLNDLTQEQLEEVARTSAGRSLADLENVINIALGRASEEETPVTQEMLINCFEETIFGEKMKISKDHLKTTALHEAGHAFMCFHCGERFYPEYATIVARGGYLGLVQRSDDETKTGYTKQELLNLIRIKLAGRAAEIVFNGAEDGLSTGASNDLEGATGLIQGMLNHYGMEEGFGPVMKPELIMASPLAEKYYNKMNEILCRELEICVNVLTANKERIDQLAEALIEKSRLETAAMKDLLGF